MESPSTGTTSRPWMPTTAGILCLVAGAVDVMLGIVMATLSEIIGTFAGFWGLGVIGTPLIILGAAAIAGGVFALQRRIWGMALAGAICALIWPFSALGIAAIILVVLSKPEFE